jgi:hypothetical protein
MIGVAVNDLRERYPQASDTELADNLVGAYCPVFASMSDLSGAQKTGRVEHLPPRCSNKNFWRS